MLDIFKRMDTDGSKVLERREVLDYWQGRFAKLNAEALFASVDVNNDGAIQLDEWIKFWRTLKTSGHTETEIEEEVN